MNVLNYDHRGGVDSLQMLGKSSRKAKYVFLQTHTCIPIVEVEARARARTRAEVGVEEAILKLSRLPYMERALPRKVINCYRPGEKKLASSFKSCPFVEYDRLLSPVLLITGSSELKMKASIEVE